MENIFKKINRFFQDRWIIAVLDLNKGKWELESKISCIPYLKAENANGRHILIKPVTDIDSYYLLADDISWTLIKLQHMTSHGKWKPGRMVIETSPNNFQVWIRSNRSLPLHEKRFWLKKLHSDPGAAPNNRWGRCPGFRNRKEKYRYHKDYYPLARLIWIDWNGWALLPHLDDDSLNSKKTFSHQPLGGVCHNNTISRIDYSRENESSTDFAYAIALIRRGFTTVDIKNRLLSERNNWKNHKGKQRMHDYLDRTIAKARDIVQNS